ncbi:MAG: YihY/virulence factor BrkB family protein [Alphaproteobacteria bacterium]
MPDPAPTTPSKPVPAESERRRAAQPGRGRRARWPGQIPIRGWKDILLRVWKEIDKDRIDLIAAGVTFWLILGLFPALVAVVAVYGLIADPTTLRDHLEILSGVVPESGMQVIEDQLDRLVTENDRRLSFTALTGLAIALWSTNTGMKALFAGIGVAYDEPEKRGFILLTLVTLMFTVGALIFGVILFTAIGAVPLVLALVYLPSDVEWLIVVVRWPIVLVAAIIGLATLYRYGPSRRRAKWRWITWGSALTTLLWLVISIAFSWYLANFSNYDRTYGSLGAVVGFMIWLWISVLVLLLGAELNAEIEHQTSIDSTVDPDLPMGQRGAVMADTVGAAVEETNNAEDSDQQGPGPDWPGAEPPDQPKR